MSFERNNRIRIAAAGETLCTRRHSQFSDQPFMDLVAIIRSADAACTNLETRIHTFAGYPMPVDTMGMEQTYQQADPFVADELRWMGFDLIARSNNHGMDFGPEMLFEEADILDAAGLLHAGAGRHLAEATRPAYLETPNGRVALISLCTDFPPHCPAGEQGRDMHGRPGINAVHIAVRHHLDDARFDALADMAAGLGQAKAIRDDKILLFGEIFERSEETKSVHSVVDRDFERNRRAINEAKRAADYVLVHMHQETPGHYPAEHVRELARKLIDAGADAIIGDGPHLLQGIEIYRGRPIFYSLGNFFYQSETIKQFPVDIYERNGLGADATPQDVIAHREAVRSGRITKDGLLPLRSGKEDEEWYEAVLVEIEFDEARLASIRLHPVWTHDARRPRRGVPRMAEPDVRRRILANIREYSEPFGTTISEDGFVDLPPE